jgi:hypothetical protein
MLGDYFVDIAAVNVLIPDLVRVDDQHRPLRATVKAPSQVDPDFALTIESEFLDAFLRIVTDLVGVVLLATLAPIWAHVGTEKNVVLVETHLVCSADSENNPERDTNMLAINSSASNGQISFIHRVSPVKLAN